MTGPASHSTDSLTIEMVPMDREPERKTQVTRVITTQPPVAKKPTTKPPIETEQFYQDIVAFEDLRGTPQYVLCPYCKTRQKTRVEHKLTDNTCKASLVCCAAGCIVGFFLPFACLCFADLNHYCEECGHLVARKPDGGEMAAVPVSTYETTNPPSSVSEAHEVAGPSPGQRSPK